MLQSFSPPAHAEFTNDAPALGEPEQMDVPWCPFTLLDEMRDDCLKVLEGGRGVWIWDQFSKRVEGRIPLESGLIQERYPVPKLVNTGGIDASSRKIQRNALL